MLSLNRLSSKIVSSTLQTSGFVSSSFSSNVFSQNHFSSLLRRAFSSAAIEQTRNIGISAHIDSGKTTLTERILFYTGRIKSIHDVRGKDGVGATMDSMDLERERGITIQSAATYCTWGDNSINIIDTPGHVDFTIEVERALRALDGGVMILCGVSGVQSQSITVDRQMKRYNVPRIGFINKLDRMGASPWKPIRDMRDQLGLNAIAVQMPIGLEEKHQGVVDLIRMKALYFDGDFGETIREEDIPANMLEEANERREELISRVADVDEEVADLFLSEEEVPEDILKAGIKNGVLSQELVPVFMGSAFKNKGVQPLLNGVVDYLPNPTEVVNNAHDLENGEVEVVVESDASKPLVALAFKLEESQYGQLTYFRIYQGTLKKGSFIFNRTSGDGNRIKVPRIVRMHADNMEEISEASAGDVVAVFGVECASMDTFTEAPINWSLTSMFVPNPVMSIAIKPKNTEQQDVFAKAMGKFTKEDPTLRVNIDDRTGETILSGMGELHLEVYVERMRREFNLDTITSPPAVNYMETISTKVPFDYLHKKQSGGQGQYGRVIGYIEPNPEEDDVSFSNHIVGTNIPPEYIPSIERGVKEIAKEGILVNCPLTRMRVVLTDGAYHAVDSSDLAFRTAIIQAIRDAVRKSSTGLVMEPIMKVEISCPTEFQGPVIGGLTRNRGSISSSESNADGTMCTIVAEVPLAQMFGYSSALRSGTEGKGEFSMEYLRHAPLPPNEQTKVIAAHEAEKQAKN